MESVRARRWFFGTWATIGVLLLAAVAWWVLREPFQIVFAPVALAAVIVYLLNPFVGRLHAEGVPRGLGATLAYMVLIGGLVTLAAVVGPLLADQVSELADNVPQIAGDLQDTINRQLRRVGVATRVNFDLASEDARETIQDFLSRNRDEVTALLRGAGNVVGALFHALLTLVLAPILAFYVLVDLPKLHRSFQRFLPPGGRREFFDVAERIGTTVGAYFRGMLLVAGFVAVATSIGLAIVGLPFWALVGFLAGLFNLIPLVGPFVGGAIGILIALTVGDGPGQAVAVVVVMTIVQQIDNHLITPNIMSRTVKVHPVTVMLALLVAGSLRGILGMLVVIPLLAAVKLVALHLLVTRVPAMSHLAALEGPGVFASADGDEPGGPAAPATDGGEAGPQQDPPGEGGG